MPGGNEMNSKAICFPLFMDLRFYSGRSWTKNWLQFDNSYFKNVLHFSRGNGDKDLLVMPTDAALYECPEFR